uniref:Uncharacterized protein n=1 Tax=Klebsiella pneumoniae TaxID=573 RepID=A0A8B0SV70_KLEPN|nr:hypothetical protein [Klebsiella pneumoniae]
MAITRDNQQRLDIRTEEGPDFCFLRNCCPHSHQLALGLQSTRWHSASSWPSMKSGPEITLNRVFFCCKWSSGNGEDNTPA